MYRTTTSEVLLEQVRVTLSLPSTGELFDVFNPGLSLSKKKCTNLCKYRTLRSSDYARQRTLFRKKLDCDVRQSHFNSIVKFENIELTLTILILMQSNFVQD